MFNMSSLRALPLAKMLAAVVFLGSNGADAVTLESLLVSSGLPAKTAKEATKMNPAELSKDQEYAS